MREQFRAVTTCSRDGWHQYGKRLARTWLEKVPEIPLAIYVEGFDGDLELEALIGHGGLVVRDLLAEEWLVMFRGAHPYRPTRGGAYDFKLDAARFAHKVAALTAEALRDDVPLGLVWVDADVIVHSPGLWEYLVGMDTGGAFCAILERDAMHPETGFLLFDMQHANAAGFFRALRRMYTLGEVFNLPEWHDAYIIAHLLRQLHMPTVDLSGPAGRRTSHPLINGPLGAYLDHAKGPRKTGGQSYAHDLRVQRTEPYWRNILNGRRNPK